MTVGAVVREAPCAAASVDELAAFERRFSYPLGARRFRIDHGSDYFAFFRDLGAPRAWVAELAGRLVGVLVAVRRPPPFDAWYLCDLKVDPETPGLGIGRRLLRAFDAAVGPKAAAFGVSMNDADGGNRLRDLALRRPGFRSIATLVVASMDFASWRRAAAAVREAFGATDFYDPAGKKDLVFDDGGRVPVLHFQHGPFARGAPSRVEARPDARHFLCTLADDPLVGRLGDAGASLATATVLERGAATRDYRLLLTSDI
ncbi:MAG TPA: GNAT family N-acetyltransferase [Planctomycetota bacterium]|nr:GNAT family N-acetyltransferase [Planctomycetota bacterium]